MPVRNASLIAARRRLTRAGWIAVLVCASFASIAWSSIARAELSSSELSAIVTTAYEAAQAQLELGGGTALDSIRAQLDAGQVEQAAHAARALDAEALSDLRLAVVRAEALLAYQELKDVRPYCEGLRARAELSEAEREILFRWLDLIDDAAAIEDRTHDVLRRSSASRSDLLAAGRLATSLLSFARAESCFAAVAARDSTDADALRGLGVVAYRRNHFDDSMRFLERALRSKVTAPLLESCAETLIRLGRTDDAIALCEWAVRFNPYERTAHYMLGNGYARKNYSELRATHPSAFLDASVLAPADSAFVRGDRAAARTAYDRLIENYPNAVEPLLRYASLAFEDGSFRDARDLAEYALTLLPEYGRAHAILAKALESETFEVDVHRAEYEARFAATPMPEVPGIERFVLNWRALSPRHQKRVALSIEPWKQFVPVLLEGGSTFYIKPLYMLLSDTPGQEALADERIGYDSRLWDDVRGCGGYLTVTGIEDVERSVYDKYNTVLHELTHQVHSVLTSDESRAIEDLYRRAKERDAESREGFSSRYAAGSVHEYFAEGANALRTPARDRFDPREITLERLHRIDPDLERWTGARMASLDVAASYPIALTNAADDLVSRNQVDDALHALAKALEREPTNEPALSSLVFAQLAAGDTATALATATRAVDAHPENGYARATRTDAAWRAGRDLSLAVDEMEAARSTIRAEDLPAFDVALGQKRWVLGQAERAIAAYDSALARQGDLPEALWGRASSLALAGRFEDAWPGYEAAVRARTGWIGLRADYARDLLRAGRVADARAQVDAALLLDPDDPSARTIDAWVAWKEGKPEAARDSLESVLRDYPWADWARVLRGLFESEDGNAAAAEAWWAPLREAIASDRPPGYVYRADRAAWQSIGELPALERSFLPRLNQPAR